MIDKKILQEKAMTEVLLEQYEKLPKALQKAVVSVGAAKIIQEIGKKHNLHVDQIGELIDETWLVLLGIIRSGDFVDDLKFRLNIDIQKAKNIAHDVNEQIFNEIKNELVEAEKIEIPSPEATKEQTLQSTEEEGDLPPSRENILGEIEDKPEQLSQPAKSESFGELIETTQKPATEESDEAKGEVKEENMPKNLMEEKLGGEFGIPSTEQVVKIKEKTEKKFDPYREAVD